MEKIVGLKISEHNNSKRIINIGIEDEFLDKLIFPLNKFDITTLEYKPFTRFTLAKSLDDLTSNKLSKLMNKIIRGNINLSKNSSSIPILIILFELLCSEIFRPTIFSIISTHLVMPS